MTVDLTGVACSVAVFVATVLASIALAFIQAHVKNQAMRAILDGAINDGLGKIQQVSPAMLAGIGALHPSMDPRLAVGVAYVQAHAADAVKHFGLQPQAIADKFLARVGVASIATNLAVSASSSPSNPAPLDPLPAGTGAQATIVQPLVQPAFAPPPPPPLPPPATIYPPPAPPPPPPPGSAVQPQANAP